jgi:Fur family zinc uptake transcriptional regulator/Fur family ferric uptake transcriptional regulator
MHDRHQAALKDLRLKATPKRLAILDCLVRERTYCSPEDVWQRLRGEFGQIGLPTVYRNLEELATGGVITKVFHPNRQLYYFYCPNREHHHHFVCMTCRRVEDVTACGLEAIEREVGERIGGRVLSHFVQVNGLCQECAARAAAGVGK